MDNALIISPPLNQNSRNILKKLWYEKIFLIKDIYYKKNAIFNSVIKIQNKLYNLFKQFSNNHFTKLNNIDNNNEIISENEDNQVDNIDEEEEKNKKTILENWTISFEKRVTMNYKNQLISPNYIDEEEVEKINIVYKNNKIQYCSIDLLLKKICEKNTLNIEIYINQERNQIFNFINAFIFQCFGFISYEILINKLMEMHNFYKLNNKLTKIINKRLLILIFKLVKYLYDHNVYECSYFKFSDELENKIKLFLKHNNFKGQINEFSEYKKKINKINMNNIIINKNEIKLKGDKGNDGYCTAGSFLNYPKVGFEFNILKYKEKDIALIITYITIKNLNNLYNHLYELNPSIKKKEKDKPHLLSIANFSNKLSNFLIEETLSYDIADTRINIVEKIIKVLMELRNLNNFNDLLSVCSALISIAMRLTKTWNMLNTKLKSKFKEIQNFCSSQGCYKNIRDEENKCLKENIFFVPYIVITIKHINFFDESFKYIGHDGLVCVEKIIVNQKEIEEFKNKLNHLKKKNYFIKLPNNNDIKELKNIFYNLNPRDLETLDNLSHKIEPEFILYKEPDIRKRISKTESSLNLI